MQPLRGLQRRRLLRMFLLLVIASDVVIPPARAEMQVQSGRPWHRNSSIQGPSSRSNSPFIGRHSRRGQSHDHDASSPSPAPSVSNALVPYSTLTISFVIQGDTTECLDVSPQVQQQMADHVASTLSVPLASVTVEVVGDANCDRVERVPPRRDHPQVMSPPPHTPASMGIVVVDSSHPTSACVVANQPFCCACDGLWWSRRPRLR